MAKLCPNREEKLQALPQGTIAWSLLWLLFEVGQQVEIVYDLTGEKVRRRPLPAKGY